MKKLLLLLSLFCGIAFSATPVAPFAKGERVVFLGDSVTRNGGYVFYLQLFEDLRHPGSGTVMMNAGIGSETAGDACRRYEHDVLKRNPDRIFVMFGLNDLGIGNYASATPTKEQEDKRQASLKNYQNNYKRLIEMILGSNRKLVVMTSSPYDQYSSTATATNRIQGNEPGMARMAQVVRKLAEESSLGLVEIHAPFTEMLKAYPEMGLCNKDRVHPSSLGHLYMAALILEAAGEDGLVAEVELDVAGKDAIVAKANNAAVSNINVRGDFGKGFAFMYAPKALPYPCMPDYKTLDTIYPITEKLNREILRIKGLPDGNYSLKANGVEIASASSKELAMGINIAILNTPSQKTAMKAGNIMKSLRNFSEKMRLMAYIDSITLKRNGNPDNYEESIQFLEKWASNLPDKKYMQRVETYKQTYPILAQKKQEELEMRKKLASFVPEAFVISVEAK